MKLPQNYQNIPASDTTNDSLDTTFESIGSDCEFLTFESTCENETQPTHIRAPHSPYILRSLAPKNYDGCQPNLSFPS